MGTTQEEKQNEECVTRLLEDAIKNFPESLDADDLKIAKTLAKQMIEVRLRQAVCKHVPYVAPNRTVDDFAYDRQGSALEYANYVSNANDSALSGASSKLEGMKEMLKLCGKKSIIEAVTKPVKKACDEQWPQRSKA